ncbi:MAG: hypothetical protein JWN95_42 [Frankiales bacterium]|nr:hypothetical protein [Frankiales bacterium]
MTERRNRSTSSAHRDALKSRRAAISAIAALDRERELLLAAGPESALPPGDPAGSRLADIISHRDMLLVRIQQLEACLPQEALRNQDQRRTETLKHR